MEEGGRINVNWVSRNCCVWLRQIKQIEYYTGHDISATRCLQHGGERGCINGIKHDDINNSDDGGGGGVSGSGGSSIGNGNMQASTNLISTLHTYIFVV